MNKLFVIDTVGFINYFNIFFGEESRMSLSTRKIIDNCFSYDYPQFKLSIPSVVFIEVFEKFLKGREIVVRFQYDIMEMIKRSSDIEVKSIDKELLTIFCSLNDDIQKLEYHDKIITASAYQLRAPIITCDMKICNYINMSTEPLDILF